MSLICVCCVCNFAYIPKKNTDTSITLVIAKKLFEISCYHCHFEQRLTLFSETMLHCVKLRIAVPVSLHCTTVPNSCYINVGLYSDVLCYSLRTRKSKNKEI